MIAKFQYEVKAEKDSTRITVSGPFDEHAMLPQVDLDKPVHLYLGGVTMLNSIGTKAWVVWIKQFSPPAQVVLYDCPMVFVKSFSLVKGFYTDVIVIQSFYIPYYSQATDEHRNFLAVRGQHFNTDSLTLPPQVDSRGNEMEIDVGSTYFSFLKIRP